MIDKREGVLSALHRLKVETGSLACLGCGHEHNCGVHGCAILRETEEVIRELIADNVSLRQRIDGITDAQAVVVKEFDRKLEELAEVKAERDALIHEAGEDKCALALMAYQYFHDTEGILWNECMNAGEAACRQLGLPNYFDKNMLWSMIEDYENTGKWRGPKKEE